MILFIDIIYLLGAAITAVGLALLISLPPSDSTETKVLVSLSVTMMLFALSYILWEL